MHNNIMAAGSRDRPSMLAARRYPQLRSRFLRYIDTRTNGEALRKCILSSPYKPTIVLVQVVKATDDSSAIPEHTTVETPMNMSPEKKAHFKAEKEAIHLILTGIGDEIYSTVDACQTAQEMFVTIVKQQHKLDEFSYHKLFDILKQYQKEVNELHAERLARNANPLALVATAQADQDPYYQTSRSHNSYAPSSKPLIPTRSHTTTRHKGKEIAKLITPPFETASKEESDPEQAQRDKDMQKNLALIAKYFKKIYKPTNNNLRTSSNSKNKNVDTTLRYKNDDHSGQFGNQRMVNVAGAREKVGSPVVQQSRIQCFNCKEFGHFAKECRKSKRVKDSTYHKEKMLLCKQVEQGVPLQAEHNTCLVETDDSNVILDSPDMCEDYIQNEQNNVESDDERVALANLKLDVDENKKIQKQLKKANTSLAQELKECKAILAETSKSLRESISIRDSCLVALQNKQTEFEKYKAFNDRTIDYDKLKQKLNETLGQLAQKDIEIKEGLKTKAYEISVVKEKHDELMKQSLLTKSHCEEIVDNAWIKHSKDQFRAPTAQDMEILIQTCLMPLAIKTQNDSFIFVHELKQEMHADLKYFESFEKEIDELESNKAEFSNMYDAIFQECVSKDVMCSYLMALSDLDVLDELQCLYLHKKNIRFLLKSLCKNVKNSKLKKLIEKDKGKYVDTKFDKPFVVRQPNAQRIPKPSVLGKPAPFSNSLDRIYFLKTKSVPKANVSEGLSKPVTAQTLPQTARQAVSNTNVLKPGVNHNTNVSKPQRKSNQLKDKVLPNNSQVKVKKTQVEVHPRIPSVSNKMKSITACKDSLNSKTLNANAVGATCNKCLVDSSHFACVTKMLNDVNARTKKPNIVQLILFIVDSGCTKHMTGNLKLLCNFAEKFLGFIMSKASITISSQLVNFAMWIWRQKVLDYDNPDPVPKRQDVSSSADAHVPSQQELDLLFGPLYDEFFNAGSNPQDKQPTTNIQPTLPPSTHTYVHAEKNTDHQAEERDHLQDDEFTNPFYAPPQDVAGSSLHDIDGCENGISQWSTEGEVYVAQPNGFVDPDHPEKYCTAMSSPEAEYVALSASCAQVMWMRTQLQDYGFNYNKIPLYCDSQSAIAISCNPVQHSLTKHIYTRYHFIKEQVENGIIELYFVRTEYQLADMFTKALPEDRFKYLVRRIGMRCLTPAELEVLEKEST
nr:retrovirus-related Pol polyprotein from transposon TNT 1-94 [Tanacetum cinerariifolium]